jgi:hypothetical protein
MGRMWFSGRALKALDLILQHHKTNKKQIQIIIIINKF